MQKNLWGSQKCITFALEIYKERHSSCKFSRSGSSVWLEYMPVTHGVASSSLVQTAKQKKETLL